MSRAVFKTEEGKDQILRFYDGMLKKYPIANQSHIDTEQGRTFVLSAGEPENPPLVLIHGSGSNSLAWMGEIEKLSQTHRVHCIDIPGEPGKSESVRFDSTREAFSLWIDDIVKGLKLKKPLIGGLSLGGWAAIAYAISHPDKVSGVIALAPTGIVKPKTGFLIRTIFYSMRGEKGIRKLLSIMFDGEPVPEEVVEFQLLATRHFHFRMDTPSLFTDRELQNLKVPLTYVCGKEDYVFDGSKAVRRLNKINPAIRTALTDKGHALTDIREFLL
ncbi:alpha/beta fold hydrolase [Spirochaeta isovalerica]|uniref:Pimeloyl-ACP methyl ester carboxylesterase n=1 Tax=Spirochaeta isovalerica TaxID=150 RepID=A0A841RH08_9SPIO|nr:alpha/beta hydrolase [Spirochaeta isovalerica]MBB6482069.1 pimeloyl-ACP methyl ester carboxylesterase [Spirochaeta isovalerica]